MALCLEALARTFVPSRATWPNLHEPGLLAEGEHLGEQARERREVLLPEGRDAVVVGVLVRRQHAVGDLLVGGPLDLAGGRLAGAVGVHQELHHQGRVVRRLAPPVAGLVGREDRGEVQRVVHHVADEAREVILRQPVLEGRGQQEQLIGCVRLEGFHAGTIPQTEGEAGSYDAP